VTAATQTQHLAVLLAQHPEECAAVVAVLATDEDNPPKHPAQDAIERLGTSDAVLMGRILSALLTAGIVHFGSRWMLAEWDDRYAIARQGAAAWLRARVGCRPVEARYANRDAIAARVASVLGCRIGDVAFEWRSSQLDSIYIGGEGLDASEIAALIKAGFEPSALGWDVPGDCGASTEETAK
jgi:hypothetical protein